MTKSRSERLTENFYTWEIWGRGWRHYEDRVELEPPFQPFPGHWLATPPPDGARQPSVAERLLGALFGPKPESAVADTGQHEREVAWRGEAEPLVALTLVVPTEADTGKLRVHSWLRSLGALGGRLAFEVQGGSGIQLTLLAPASARRMAEGQPGHTSPRSASSPPRIRPPFSGDRP